MLVLNEFPRVWKDRYFKTSVQSINKILINIVNCRDVEFLKKEFIAKTNYKTDIIF